MGVVILYLIGSMVFGFVVTMGVLSVVGHVQGLRRRVTVLEEKLTDANRAKNKASYDAWELGHTAGRQHAFEEIEMGWCDASIAARLQRCRLDAVKQYAAAVRVTE